MIKYQNQLDDFIEHIKYFWDGDIYYNPTQDDDIIESLNCGAGYLETYQNCCLNQRERAPKP